jgi:hypothetical protein
MDAQDEPPSYPMRRYLKLNPPTEDSSVDRESPLRNRSLRYLPPSAYTLDAGVKGPEPLARRRDRKWNCTILNKNCEHCDYTAKRWYQIVEHTDVEHPEQQGNTIDAL